MEGLRRAFSLRRNLQALFVPPGGQARQGGSPGTRHLRPLDGVRALAILWVLVFHAGWYAAWHIPPPSYGAMLVSPWMLPVWRGDFGVDVFFVLSGFLIAGMLIDEEARAGRIRLGLFYARRLLRLWPGLMVAMLADVVLIGDNSPMVWANLLYVSNLVPIREAAMGWCWSLAIEEQFYLVCPWLIGALGEKDGQSRLRVLGGLAMGLCVIGAWVVRAGGFHAMDSEIVITRDYERWAMAFDALYSKPWMRAGPLLAGVAGAYVYRMPRAMAALGRQRVAPALGLAAALLLAVTCTHWPAVASAPRAVEIAFMATFRTLFGIAVGYAILLSLSDHPAGRGMGWLLSSRWLYPISQLAYSAYLLNPIVTTCVDRALAPRVWLGRADPMSLFLPWDVGLTLLFAAVLHVLVERPFMELRPRAAH